MLNNMTRLGYLIMIGAETMKEEKEMALPFLGADCFSRGRHNGVCLLHLARPAPRNGRAKEMKTFNEYKRPGAVSLMGRRLMVAAWLTISASTIQAAELLVEAESFSERGGWVVDQQFIDIMGSPYLLAHGLGKPVVNAKTTIEFPETGTYRVWVRTKDWVPEPEWSPGRFKVVVGGKLLPAEFGTTGEGTWVWQDGGSVEIIDKTTTVELSDLTGFAGRCDALFFTKDKTFTPPAKPDKAMRLWRKQLLGLPDIPPSGGTFDVVVVGGGLAGCSAAITAARLGLQVALIQNRPVYGGNNSPEIRIHCSIWGVSGPFVTHEIKAENNFGRVAVQRQKVIDNEPNIKQFVGWHMFSAQTNEDAITSVDAMNIYTSHELRLTAPVFIDCTGDGWVGYHAGADYRYGQEARDEHNEPLAPEKASEMTLGSSLIWDSVLTDSPMPFPDVPWAEVISKGKSATSGDWMWEYGHYRDTIWEAEEIRDYLFRAIFGSFATAKRQGGGELAKRALRQVNYIVGKRESRRLMGDYIMTQADCWDTTTKDDAVAKTNNPFDLHVPTKRHDFIIEVDHRWPLNKRRDYDIPFRSLYSRNVTNLMMAGRCISTTRIAHSSTRVQNTGGQTGVAVGAAAYLCTKYNTTPRVVYKDHIKELQDIVFGKGEYVNALNPR